MRTILIIIGIMLAMRGLAMVKYDEGSLIINGIMLFQDRDAPQDYYYLPQYPKISLKQDGSLELLFIKYVGEGGPAANGGIFHALIEFALTPDEIAELETLLSKKAPGARLRGPVPMMEALKDGQSGMAGFKIISSVLNHTSSSSPFTHHVITSGHSPFLPGSKAAIAAHLSQQGATLLWESFKTGTSDVSVSVEGYFEAAVKGYNAVIEADLNTLYEHFSSLQNIQGGFTREQTRKIADSLVQHQKIRIDVFDRSAGLGISTEDMQKIMDILTNQLIGLMFDNKGGWAKLPEGEKPADAQVKGRYSRGGLAGFLFGAGSQAYVPDNQYILKERKDIRSFNFFLNLSKSTTIKVPVYTSGNLRGLYDLDSANGKYFRVVNLDDPDFQHREVYFQINADFSEGFNDLINFVSVNFRKPYGEDNGFESTDTSLVFSKKDISNGTDLKSVSYPRLGLKGPAWLDYEYQIHWSVRGLDSLIRFPAQREQWAKSNLPSIALSPPFKKRVIEIDADRQLFRDNEISSATVRFFVILGGKAMFQKAIALRREDAANTNVLTVYHDPNEPVAYQTTWYSNNEVYKEDLRSLDGEYLFLIPPNKNNLKK